LIRTTPPTSSAKARADVYINEKMIAKGEGHNVRTAKKRAAATAVKIIKQNPSYFFDKPTHDVEKD
jgi:dsRNA-specific ribonuclease